MSETIRCPDCGHENPNGSASCSHCNFPLVAEGLAPPAAPPLEPAASEPIRRPLPRRPRPRPSSQQALSLWLMFAFIMAASVIYIAVKANVERARQPVEGSDATQQGKADEFRAALDKDSTNLEARVGLANVLYDTGNWSEAIVHYRSVIARDSSHTSVLVDLGVCYYNLSHPDEAERLFQLALARDPHQPVALFNLGIVYERRSDLEAALKYYHRSLESGPPEQIKPSIIEAMQRVLKQTGKVAPPLPDGK